MMINRSETLKKNWKGIARLRERVEKEREERQKSYTLKLHIEEDFKKKEEGDEGAGKEHQKSESSFIMSEEQSHALSDSAKEMFGEERRLTDAGEMEEEDEKF